jgi:hypothetical protein
MRRVRVRCTFEVVVEVPDEWDAEMIHFDIEDNHCPGTGRVGAALEDAIEGGDASGMCWACGRNGRNEILEIEPL